MEDKENIILKNCMKRMKVMRGLYWTVFIKKVILMIF